MNSPELYPGGCKARNIRSPLSGYVGGKFLLSRTIIPLIPAHVCYCEPFCGAAWVYFRKPKSPTEVLNDANGELVNAYQVIRDNAAWLENEARWSLHSRLIFETFRDMNAEELAELTKEEAAWRWLYLLKSSFGGKGIGDAPRQAFGTCKVPQNSPSIKKASSLCRPAPRVTGAEAPAGSLGYATILSVAQERLRNTQLECLDFGDCIRRYDSRDSFFYLDPPYIGCENYYGKGRFAPADLERLADILASLKGRFILSINEHPRVRELFGGFHCLEVQAHYSLEVHKTKPVGELLFMNFQPDKE